MRQSDRPPIGIRYASDRPSIGYESLCKAYDYPVEIVCRSGGEAIVIAGRDRAGQVYSGRESKGEGRF